MKKLLVWLTSAIAVLSMLAGLVTYLNYLHISQERERFLKANQPKSLEVLVTDCLGRKSQEVHLQKYSADFLVGNPSHVGQVSAKQVFCIGKELGLDRYDFMEALGERRWGVSQTFPAKGKYKNIKLTFANQFAVEKHCKGDWIPLCTISGYRGLVRVNIEDIGSTW
jgi:hypothetical protein